MSLFVVENRKAEILGTDEEYKLPEKLLYDILRYQEEIIKWSVMECDSLLFIELIKFTEYYEGKFKDV